MTPAQTKRIDDARRLLRARIDRRAPDDMIERARRDLAEALEDVTSLASREGRYSVEEGVAKLLPWIVGLPLAIGVGLAGGKLLHSDAGRRAVRSLVRGMIYRSIGTLGR